MSGVLFLAHRVPFPPDRGDKIRSHHILKALSNLGPVYVGCLADTAAERAGEMELARVSTSYCMPARTKPLALAGLEALCSGKPVSLKAFEHRELARWVRFMLATTDIDTVYVFSGQMGQYVPKDWTGRLVVDLVDVDSAKFEAYSAEKPMPMRWVNAREARLLRAEETRLAARATHTLLVSDAEAALLASRLPAGVKANISALGNGIDATTFNPGRVRTHPALVEGAANIVFTGQMDYPPNVEAALRMIDCIMPRVLASMPEARLHIVGRSPAPELVARDGVCRSRVWGEVPDVRPFLSGADLVLAPLSIARGVQNKVLEAMAMARPVVLTTAAATGVPGVDGTHFAVADTDQEIASRALGLLSDRERASRMGTAARDIVVEQRSWRAMLEPLPAIVGRPRDRNRRRHAA
ncbi:TIGR03087 family PEP-CTERM/XrtA system glycosyltransferase [Croceibacterium sp. LX-88]|uniref:TIGR03087 family PEP-CTERM/XrtA system glycosyltransferase n=1 Tax=Croceibacterium selenioxidans TaxID=2838833 RepID=A0ABS5W3K6_9SPHN|nr:TIGR03087 family PEP-CTERM/XrtA system glycosyltransferase [Croceibacterium selenioxidans]MBT2133897.1 TIGR03087 family PEP-CTERM/XrtA system glycosyltransferase [Croceibacterium selenioxidans]